MITNFKLFENAEIWNDFINKVNTGVLPKDPPDVKNIEKLAKIKPSGKVLDISVGDGAHSEYFIEKGYEVFGTDISDLAIKTIEEKYPEHNWIVHDTEQKFPFSDNMFDIVFARLAIHYFSMESIDRILLDIKRILKSTGILFIMVKISNAGNIDTGKKQYTEEEWLNMVKDKFDIIDSNFEVRKAYTFEKTPSNLLEITAINE